MKLCMWNLFFDKGRTVQGGKMFSFFANFCISVRSIVTWVLTFLPAGGLFGSCH